MPKLKTFLVNYYFDGEGTATIKAKSKKEAEDKFYSGDDWLDEETGGENYVIETINDVVFCSKCGCQCNDDYVETINNKNLCYACDSKRLIKEQ